jgi:methionine-rich copper-binding protein CopC
VGFAAALGSIAPAAAGTIVRHLTLDASVPAADTAVTAPVAEVRLTFSEAPLLRGTSVRVVDSGRSLMPASPPRSHESDPRQVYVTLDPPLTSGAYTVQWRVIAQDGHVMRGNFGFEVIPE